MDSLEELEKPIELEWEIRQVKQALKAICWIRDGLLQTVHRIGREGIGRKVRIKVSIGTFIPQKEDKNG